MDNRRHTDNSIIKHEDKSEQDALTDSQIKRKVIKNLNNIDGQSFSGKRGLNKSVDYNKISEDKSEVLNTLNDRIKIESDKELYAHGSKDSDSNNKTNNDKTIRKNRDIYNINKQALLKKKNSFNVRNQKFRKHYFARKILLGQLLHYPLQ